MGFDIIEAAATRNLGDVKALKARLPLPKSAAQLGKIADDRYLSAMSQAVFQSGFVWRVVRNKWPQIEAACGGFDPYDWAHKGGAELDKLLGDQRMIRHARKIAAIRVNAQFVFGISQENGGFGRFLAGWPDDDTIGLFSVMKKQGSRLGGNTGPFFLRAVGKDTYLLTADVVSALVNLGIVDGHPTSKRDLLKVQGAFNGWREETGLPLCQLSRILAFSVSKPSLT